MYKYKFPCLLSLHLPASQLTDDLGTTRHFPLNSPRPQNWTLLKTSQVHSILAFVLLAVWILVSGVCWMLVFRCPYGSGGWAAGSPVLLGNLGHRRLRVWRLRSFLSARQKPLLARLPCVGMQGRVKTIIPVPDRGSASAMLWTPSPFQGGSHSSQQSRCLYGVSQACLVVRNTWCTRSQRLQRGAWICFTSSQRTPWSWLTRGRMKGGRGRRTLQQTELSWSGMFPPAGSPHIQKEWEGSPCWQGGLLGPLMVLRTHRSSSPNEICWKRSSQRRLTSHVALRMLAVAQWSQLIREEGTGERESRGLRDQRGWNWKKMFFSRNAFFCF